jgi:hypothetical protein
VSFLKCLRNGTSGSGGSSVAPTRTWTLTCLIRVLNRLVGPGARLRQLRQRRPQLFERPNKYSVTGDLGGRFLVGEIDAAGYAAERIQNRTFRTSPVGDAIARKQSTVPGADSREKLLDSAPCSEPEFLRPVPGLRPKDQTILSVGESGPLAVLHLEEHQDAGRPRG